MRGIKFVLLLMFMLFATSSNANEFTPESLTKWEYSAQEDTYNVAAIYRKENGSLGAVAAIEVSIDDWSDGRWSSQLKMLYDTPREIRYFMGVTFIDKSGSERPLYDCRVVECKLNVAHPSQSNNYLSSITVMSVEREKIEIIANHASSIVYKFQTADDLNKGVYTSLAFDIVDPDDALADVLRYIKAYESLTNFSDEERRKSLHEDFSARSNLILISTERAVIEYLEESIASGKYSDEKLSEMKKDVEQRKNMIPILDAEAKEKQATLMRKRNSMIKQWICEHSIKLCS